MTTNAKRKPRETEAPQAPTRALVPWGGEQVDVDQFWAESWVDLLNRQRWMARKMKITNAPWTVDQQAGLISFDRKDGAVVTAPVQIIGAWNPRSQMFRWGWDHPMVAKRLRADAERTRWFGDKHELPELTVKSLKMSEEEAWQMTALAMKVNASHGVYRGPTEGPVIFMTLGKPRIK